MKLAKLKRIAREYHRHPAGAPGGMGGQFASKGRTLNESALSTAVVSRSSNNSQVGSNQALSEFSGNRKGAKGTILEGRNIPDGFPESGFKSAIEANEWLSNRFPRTKFQLDGVKGRLDQHSLDYDGKKLTNRGLDGEMATLVALTFTRLATDFPDVADQINALRSDDTMKKALGTCSYLGLGQQISGNASLPYIGIRLNSSLANGYKTKSSSAEIKLEKAKTNWVVLSKIDAAEQSLIHEFGHAIDFYMGQPSTINPIFNDRAAAESLSGYAKKDAQETFAEAFSAYYTGVRLNHPAVQETGRLIEGLRRR